MRCVWGRERGREAEKIKQDRKDPKILSQQCFYQKNLKRSQTLI